MIDTIWTDVKRQRALPLRIRMPKTTGVHPLILFSHGLGLDRTSGGAWATSWCDAGFAVITVQHPGSDSDTLKKDRRALRDALSAEHLATRTYDLSFVLDEIAVRHEDTFCAQIRVDSVGVVGHSYGAQTALAISGHAYAIPMPQMIDARVKSLVVLSASLSRSGGLSASERFNKIKIPTLVVTGTQDFDPLGNRSIDLNARRQVFEGLPRGSKGFLVLEGADHMTLAGCVNGLPTDIGLRMERSPEKFAKDPQYHAAIANVTTQWWRKTLLDVPDEIEVKPEDREVIHTWSLS
jgi:predicted dienelactone hydrolase